MSTKPKIKVEVKAGDVMQMAKRKDKMTVEVLSDGKLLKWAHGCIWWCNKYMEGVHALFVCVFCALGSAWPAGRGSSKVIVLKGIGGRVVRAAPLTALGEGDVRRTNPKLLHSTQRHQPHQGTEEQRGGKQSRKKREERREREDTRESDRTTASRKCAIKTLVYS